MLPLAEIKDSFMQGNSNLSLRNAAKMHAQRMPLYINVTQSCLIGASSGQDEALSIPASSQPCFAHHGPGCAIVFSVLNLCNLLYVNQTVVQYYSVPLTDLFKGAGIAPVRSPSVQNGSLLYKKPLPSLSLEGGYARSLLDLEIWLVRSSSTKLQSIKNA